MENMKMKKEINQYLHLYLGCGCIMKPGKTETEESFSTITWADLGYPHNVKALILRPLPSMTEEEAVKIGEIVIGTYDSVKFRVDRHDSPSGIFRYWKVHKEHRGYGKSLTIDEKGEVDVYDNHDDGSHTIYMHQHEVTRYLLSKGFDLFELHEAGLCIYKTEVEKAKTDQV